MGVHELTTAGGRQGELFAAQANGPATAVDDLNFDFLRRGLSSFIKDGDLVHTGGEVGQSRYFPFATTGYLDFEGASGRDVLFDPVDLVAHHEYVLALDQLVTLAVEDIDVFEQNDTIRQFLCGRRERQAQPHRRKHADD